MASVHIGFRILSLLHHMLFRKRKYTDLPGWVRKNQVIW